MNEITFLQNLCAALAHTLVREQQAIERAAGVAPGYYRNDTTYQPPDQSKVAASSMLAEMQAMKGIGPFAETGSLPDLIKQFQPTYTQLSLQSTNDYMNGVNGTPGMLDMQATSIAPAMAKINSSQRASDLADVQNLGPQAMAALRAYNPQVTANLDTLNNQASQQLQLNGALDPFTKTALGQDVRSGQAARGVGTGYGDAAAEAYYQDATRNQRRQQAQNFAGTVTGTTGAYYGDPFLQILGRTGTGTAMAAYGQGAGGAAAAVSPVTSGFSMSNPMISQAYGAQNQANAANAASQNDMMGGLISGGFSMAGGAMGAAGNAGGFGKLFTF